MSLKNANYRKARWARFYVLHKHGAETLSRAQIRALLQDGVMLTSQNCCQPTLGFLFILMEENIMLAWARHHSSSSSSFTWKNPSSLPVSVFCCGKKINVHDIHYPAPVMFSASLSSSVLPTRSPWLHCLCLAFADTRPNNVYFRLISKLHIKKLTLYLEHLKDF